MPSNEQLQKIWLLSDTLLYEEAVSFIRKLVNEQRYDPLPTSQVSGLLSIADSFKYNELYQFIVHQRDRDWQYNKRNIKAFYTALEQVLTEMRLKRLNSEFHLLGDTSKFNATQLRNEVDALMALLAREFIQHIVAENGVLAANKNDEWVRQRHGRRQA